MTPPCNIRPGNIDDLSKILELDRRLIAYDVAFDPSLDTDWSTTDEAREFYSDRLSGAEGAAFVAETADGALAGFMVGAEASAETYRRPVRLAEAECLFVDEAFRGQRLGQQLMDAFAAWAKERGMERLSLTVSASNRRARDFYERLGFSDYDVVLERPL